MSKTLEQIFATNPTTVVQDTDLYYLVQSPYTPGTDAGISGASLKAAFGAGGTINPGLGNQMAYYASSGSTISGLTTLANGALVTNASGVPSISQTLPNAVQNNITRLGTIVSIGTPLGGTFGGTGINNGASTITIGGSFSMVGAFTFAGTLTGNTAVTFPTSGTLATTSQLLVSPLTTKGDLWGFSTTNDRVPVATGNGKVLQVDSTASTGVSYSTATFPTTATATGTLLRANGTNWVASTATFADTYTANNILFASATNTVTGLASSPNSVLVTSAGSVPSLSTTLPSGLTIPGFAHSGTNTDITSMTGLTGTLQAPTGVTSSTGANLLAFTYTASAVNYLGFINNITGSAPSIVALGSDTNIILQLTGKGTGGVSIAGTGTNDNATTGFVGEYVESVVAAASAVTFTNTTVRDLTSISLTAGDWDIWGNITYPTVGASAPSQLAAWISSTSATVPDASLTGQIALTVAGGVLAGGTCIIAPSRRFSLSTTTTIYISGVSVATSGNATGCGRICARRVR